jgi:hypothetical protein
MFLNLLKYTYTEVLLILKVRLEVINIRTFFQQESVTISVNPSVLLTVTLMPLSAIICKKPSMNLTVNEAPL